MFKKSAVNNKCNIKEDLAFKKAEEAIKKLKFEPQSAAPAFQEKLKQQLWQSRAGSPKLFMKNVLNFFYSLIKLKTLIPVVSFCLVLSLLLNLVSVLILTQPAESPFTGFSKLIVSTAYAQDNFSLTPTKSDSAGVAADSKFILSSKEPVETALIKEQLKFEPAIPYDLKQVSETEWEVSPASPVKANDLLKISLPTAYADEQGNLQERDYAWAFQISTSFKIISYLPAKNATFVPVTTGIEITFSYENFSLETLKQYFQMAPSVAGRFEKHGRTAVFVPQDPLSYQTIYTVFVKKGFPLENTDKTLTADFMVSFETEKKDSWQGEDYFNVYNRAVTFPQSIKPSLALATNLANEPVSVAVYSFASWDNFWQNLQERDKFPYWSSSYQDYQVNVNNLTKIVSFDAEIKQTGYQKYLDFPDNLNKGYYLVELTVKNNKTQVWLQISDLVAYVNATKTDTLVWVNNVAEQLPQIDAKVEVLGTDWQQNTNSDGVVKFASLQEWLSLSKEKNNFYGYQTDNVNSGQDKRYYFKITSVHDSLLAVAFDPTYAYYNNSDDYYYYLYTDRDFYQPEKETINFWGILKPRQGAAVEDEVSVVLRKNAYVDYFYQPVFIQEQKLKLNAQGVFFGQININNLKPDSYSLELKLDDTVIASKYLQVVDYIKPAYDLTLVPDKYKVFVGEEVKLKAKASFFEGTPLPDLKLSYDTPDGLVNDLTTDALGEVALTYKMDNKKTCPADNGSGLCWPFQAQLNVQPQKGEMSNIYANTEVTVFGPKVYLEHKEEYLEKNKVKITLQSYWLDLSLDDVYTKNRANNVKFTGSIKKVTYRAQETGTYYDFISKRTYKTYDYIREEKEIASLAGETDSRGEYVLSQDMESAAYYIVSVKYFDENGRFNQMNFIYSQNGYETRDLYYGPDYVYLHTAVSRYELGQSVTASFMREGTPLPAGKQKFLYMQLANGLLTYQVSDVSSYEFVFGLQHIPGVYLAGVYFDGFDYQITNDYSNYLFYNIDNVKLNIKVTSDKTVYAPGDIAALAVEVTDKDGRPVAASVNLNLVDEAYYAFNQEVADPSDIYRGISTGKLYSGSSRYLDNRAMAGAEKGGGGGARQSFKDTALFFSGSTDSFGKMDLKFTLPDNITSWRITAQAVTETLKVGVSTSKLPVTLPVFVAADVLPEVLLADKPQVKLRVFGSALQKGDAAYLQVENDQGLPVANYETQAFTPIYFLLKNLMLGENNFVYKVQTAKGDDSVKLPVNVLSSRLEKKVAQNFVLTKDTKIAPVDNQPLDVVLVDQGQNSLYPYLYSLSYESGERVDQILARKGARELLAKYYQEDIWPADFDKFSYQQYDGGISLLPYSFTDLELSVRVALSTREQFDQEALAQYFYKILNQESHQEEISLALTGLAALQKPVLPQLQLWVNKADLTPKEKVYLALGLAAIGDKEGARKIYQQLLEKYAYYQEPNIIIKISEDMDAVFQMTALMADLGSRLQTKEREGLWRYLITAQELSGYKKNSETLFDFEKLNYLTYNLAQLKPSPAKVIYELAGAKQEVTLTGGQKHVIYLEPQLVDSLKFSEITGNVGMSVIYNVPTAASASTTADLNIKREYYVNGQKTNNFKEGETVEVRLYPSFGARALDEAYQITDILPSGLMPVTRPFAYNQNWDCGFNYPYNIEGQKVKYIIYKNWNEWCKNTEYIYYYALPRVAGEYQAEPALLQSFLNATLLKFSEAASVIINP